MPRFEIHELIWLCNRVHLSWKMLTPWRQIFFWEDFIFYNGWCFLKTEQKTSSPKHFSSEFWQKITFSISKQLCYFVLGTFQMFQFLRKYCIFVFIKKSIWPEALFFSFQFCPLNNLFFFVFLLLFHSYKENFITNFPLKCKKLFPTQPFLVDGICSSKSPCLQGLPN